MRPIRLLSLALVVFAFGCAETETAEEEAEAPTPEEYPDAVTADPDRYVVAYENDAVRLIRVNYGAGESSVMHSHPAHCAVALGASTWRMTDPEGAATDMSFEMGDLQCVEAVAHVPENMGSEPGEGVLIEFKEGATAGSDELPEHPDAVSADPERYSAEFENDLARLIRITYGPGETSVMHMHPASCAIFLSDQPTTMELPSGEVEEMPAHETGDVECFDAEAHLPTNTGDEGLELILVELKGRAALEG